MSKALNKGWLPYTEYCRTRGIPINGNEIRKLAKVPDELKENITPTSTRVTWAVDADGLDELWVMKKGSNDESN